MFENQPNEICSHLCEKASKGTCLQTEKLQNHSKKVKERGKGKNDKKEKRRRKKAMVTFLVFKLPTLEMAHFDRFAEFLEKFNRFFFKPT